MLYFQNVAFHAEATKEVGLFNQRLGPGTSYLGAEDRNRAIRVPLCRREDSLHLSFEAKQQKPKVHGDRETHVLRLHTYVRFSMVPLRGLLRSATKIHGKYVLW